VLLVVVDDLGSYDLGYKNNVVESPTINAMAADGVRLTSYYAFHVCSPTRASMLTGRYNWRQGIYGNGSPQYNAPNIAFTLLPQVLKEVAGYRKYQTTK
jgi:arylsulfatase A-like enzyme